MISTSSRPRAPRVRIAALLLSVLNHRFGGAHYAYGRRLLPAAGERSHETLGHGARAPER
jgi:hypothetical protein